MILQQLSVNQEIAEKGVPCEFDGATFIIASLSSRRYQKALMNEMQQIPPHKKKDIDVQRQVVIKCAAAHILKTWEGDVRLEEGGDVLPPTLENRITLLENDNFRTWVIDKAGDIEAYQNGTIGNVVEEVKP